MPITLNTPSERARLDVRDTPYFWRVSDALHIGYKKGKSVSRWIVRWRVPSGYVSRTVGGVIPDDEVPANNRTVLSFEQALMRVMNMNIENIDSNQQKQCSFCGRTQLEVGVLVAGVSTFICDACIKRSSDILASTEPSGHSVGGLVEVLLNPGIEFQMHSSALKNILQKTSFAMGDQDKRTFLNGVLIEIEQDRIRAVATNGHWLATCETQVNHGLEHVQHMILARDGVVELQMQLESVTEDLTVSIKDNYFCVDSSDVACKAELLFGKYPNYREVVPNHPHAVVLNRESLRSLIKKQQVNEANRLIVRLVDGLFMVRGDKSEHWDRLNVDYQGTEINTGFNQTYLVDVLDAIVGDRVKVNFNTVNSSWRFEAADKPDAIYIVMPMKID